MNAKRLFSGFGMMIAIAIVCLTSSQAFAVEDEWSDYDPCGWNVEEETTQQELSLAEINEDKWTDYDPCGWNVEQETVTAEIATASPALFNR